MAEQKLHDLGQALQCLCDALQAGRLDQFEALALQLEQRTAEFGDQASIETLPATLVDLATKARTLLEAARLGLQSARLRLDELVALQAGLSSYGQDGVAKRFAVKDPKTLRRI